MVVRMTVILEEVAELLEKILRSELSDPPDWAAVDELSSQALDLIRENNIYKQLGPNIVHYLNDDAIRESDSDYQKLQIEQVHRTFRQAFLRPINAATEQLIKSWP
jgi:hypothetical protein